MYHFYDVVINDTTGVPLSDVIIRLYLNDVIVPLFADAGGTVPIQSVSGIANGAVSDGAGNYDFYVADGTYDMRFFIGDAVLKILPAIQMVVAASTADVAGKANATAIGVAGTASNLGAFTTPLVDDNVTAKAALESVGTNLADATKGASLVGYRPDADGVSTTVDVILRQTIYAVAYGVKADATNGTLGSGTDNSAAWDKAIAKALAVKGRLILPAGVVRLASSKLIDIGSIKDRGIAIEGSSMRGTIIQMDNGAELAIGGTTDSFMSSFRNFSVHGNVPTGPVLRLGRTDNTDPINLFLFEAINVANFSTNPASCGWQLNYVLQSTFTNCGSINAGFGDGWQINAASFCQWNNPAGSFSQNGMRFTNGPSPAEVKGNIIIGGDFEENRVCNIRIDSPNVQRNTFIGGQHVYYTTAYLPSATYGFHATAGAENLIINPNYLLYPSGTASLGNFLNGQVGLYWIKLFGTTKVLNGNPSFRAAKSSSQSVTAGTWTKVTFGTPAYSDGGAYDTSTSRFTATVGGIYSFAGRVNIDAVNASNAIGYIGLRVNGTEVSVCGYSVASGGNFVGFSISDQIVLNVGDYVEVWANIPASSGSPSIQSGVNTSYFSGQFNG